MQKIQERNAKAERELEELQRLRMSNKRRRADNGPRIPSKKTCGAYNHTGCGYTAEKCRFVHKYDLKAGQNYYKNVVSELQIQKGLKENCHYPEEFKDLRMRNVESLTNTEQETLAKMPHLDSKKKPTTAKVEGPARKKKAKKAIDGESELAKPQLES